MMMLLDLKRTLDRLVVALPARELAVADHRRAVPLQREHE